MSDIHQQTINTIRILAADMVQKAKSGHPGAPMGMAPIAYALYGNALKMNPADPDWADRDRFVLSSGHASPLIYSLLHLFKRAEHSFSEIVLPPDGRDGKNLCLRIPAAYRHIEFSAPRFKIFFGFLAPIVRAICHRYVIGGNIILGLGQGRKEHLTADALVKLLSLQLVCQKRSIAHRGTKSIIALGNGIAKSKQFLGRLYRNNIRAVV